MIINKTQLKKFSPIPLNYNMDEVMNYCDVSELIWIVPIIGDALYEEITEQVKDDSLSEENSTALVEAIWPLEGFAVVHEALPMLWGHLNEVGLTKGHSENSDPLSLKEVTLIQQHVRNQTEVRQAFMKKWFDEHADSFPLYPAACDCNKCCNNNIPPKYPRVYAPRKCDDSIR